MEPGNSSHYLSLKKKTKKNKPKENKQQQQKTISIAFNNGRQHILWDQCQANSQKWTKVVPYLAKTTEQKC